MLLAGAMLTGVILAQRIGHSVGRQCWPGGPHAFRGRYALPLPLADVLGADLLVTTFLVFSRRETPRAAVAGFVVAGVGIFFAGSQPALPRLSLDDPDASASLSISFVVLGAAIALDTWRTARIPGERVTGTLSKADTSHD